MNHTYKLRAEAFADLVNLADALFPHGRLPLKFTSLSMHVTYDTDNLPDFEMEVTSPLTLDDLLAIVAGIEDGHVMYETVQPIEHYTGEREWDRQAREEVVVRDLDAVMLEMEVATAEINLASARMRLNKNRNETNFGRAEAELHAALRRVGDLDVRREALQEQARCRRGD